MSVELLKAKKEDFDDLIDFANYVFSHDGERCDFPSLLPKLYKQEYNQIENHYIVKENGKIKAVVGVFPMELNVLGNPLKVNGIGTVCVHPYSRGSSYMKKLMNLALEDMRKQGVHMSCLGGGRQRYEYFQYTPCGQKVYFTVNDHNVKHKLSTYLNQGFEFKKVDDENLDMINQAYELYNASEYKFIREKDSFLDVLKSWNFHVYFIYHHKDFIVYLVVNKETTYISELMIKDNKEFISVLANYVNDYQVNSINIELPVWEKQKIKELTQVAEEVTLYPSYQFNVLNYEAVIRQLLRFKSTNRQLLNGRMSFEVLDYGKFEIVVGDEGMIVNSFNGDCDIKLNHLESMQLFFSPFGNYLVENDSFEKLIHSWFPLPLFIPSADKV